VIGKIIDKLGYWSFIWFWSRPTWIRKFF